MSSYAKLVTGYKKFRDHYLDKGNDDWRHAAQKGQNPKVMMITCSDSRVEPAIITESGLGDIFTVKNVANLVPPYKKGKDTHHSTSAAIEYAVNHLKVEHIIVMGHSGCGGIRALMSDDVQTQDHECDTPYSFIKPWMEIVSDAADFTEQEKTSTPFEDLATICEKRAILISMDHLMSFPWVKDAVDGHQLQLHGWHFDIGSGVLKDYNQKSDQFEDIF